jgi:RND family efflux transporter MFP subunit
MCDKTVAEIAAVSTAPHGQSQGAALRRHDRPATDNTRDQRSRKTGRMKMLTKGVIIVVAVTVVLAGAGVGVYSVSQTGNATAENAVPEGTEKRIPVVLTPAKEMAFESTVVVSGNVQAKNYALVSARIPGSLDAVYVDEGDLVEATKTRLFQTDSLKLTKAVAMGEQDLKVAEFSVKEKEASLEQMLADKEQAKVDLERYRDLILHNAVPRQLVEQQESRFKQSSAMVKHSEALLALEKTKLEQARVSLTMTQKDLADALVIAPISGRVSQRFVEPGEMAAAGTPVVKIEDLSVLEISVFLPEEFYARVEPGKTQMRIEVSGIDLGVQPVTYKSPTVNAKLRTFEVKGLVEPPPGVAPGCLAEVAIVMDERSGVGVPAAAIGQRGGHSVVFIVEGEQARMVEVKTGRTISGWVEIVEGEVSDRTPVLTMGQHLVEDGTPVSPAQEATQ